MAETAARATTFSGIPEHRGHWPTTWQPCIRREHTTSGGNSKANNGKAVDVGQGSECNATDRSAGDKWRPVWSRDCLRLIYEPMMDGVQGQFQAVGDAELVEDVVQVVLDGLFGDEEFFADFLVAEALGD
jgi:hypothetical protein